MDPVPQTYDKQNSALHHWVWLILLLVVAAIYVSSMQGGFYLDDLAVIQQNQAIRDLGQSLSRSLLTARGPVKLSFAINYAIGELDPSGYRLGNVLIHWINAVLLYLLLVRVLTCQQVGYTPNRAVGLAMCASLVWVLHPLASQPVLYVSQRSELMMASFFIATLYAFVRSVQSQMHRRVWQVLAVVCCALAILCKLVAFSLPIVVLLLDRLLLSDRWKTVWQQRRWVHASLFACWALLWAIGFFSLFETQSNTSSAGGALVGIISPFEYLTVQSGVILHYLKLCLWPSVLVFDYGWPPPTSFSQYAWAFSVVAVLFCLTVLLLVRSTRWSILPMSFFLILAPTSSLMPIADLAVEHRMYLPLVCVCVGVTLLLGHVLGRQFRLAVILLLAVSVVLGLRTMVRVQDYRSSLTLWRSVLNVIPNAPRARLQYAQALVEARRIDQAVEQFHIGIKHHSQDSRFYHNLGELYLQIGLLDRARPLLEKALSMQDNDPVYWFNLAKLDRLEGRTDQALRGFEKTLTLDPNHVGALSDLADILAATGRWDEALARLDQAQSLAGDQPVLQINRANILLRAGRAEPALAAAQQAVAMLVDHPATLNVLASAYAANGMWADARDVFSTLLTQSPNNPGICQRLAWLLATCPDPAVRNGQQAVDLANQFVKLTSEDNPVAWDTLAAALAQCGQYDQAVKAMDQGIAKLKEAGHEQLLETYQQRRSLYEQGKAYELAPSQ
ncbi:MAG: tetratricopeptide repeat protein [Phycisphaeraceae bacterium JB051]